jgi:DNA gyrase/topoisomerase IV subunit A
MENQDVQEIASKKRFLKRYRKNLNCINRLEEKLALLEIKLNSVRSPNMSGMPRGGQPVTIADLVADKADLESRIERLKKKSKKLKYEILEEIDSLDDPRYVAILEGFFIDCLSMEDIADNEGYTVRHVYTLYHDAVRALTVKEQ